MTYDEAIARLFEARRERDDAERCIKGLRLEVARLVEERNELRAELARRTATRRPTEEGDPCLF